MKEVKFCVLSIEDYNRCREEKTIHIVDRVCIEDAYGDIESYGVWYWED